MTASARGLKRSQAGPPPKALAGFEHVKRYWDKTRGAFAAKILPGEYYVTRSGELVTTVLGSCVSACVRDRRFGIGGMNHFMLPESTECDPNWAGTKVNAATRYGSYAMEHLINDILSAGGQRRNLEVKIFGGGRIISAMTDIGRRNIAFVEEFIRMEKLTLVGEDVADIYPRKVVYQPGNGRAWVKKLRCMHNDTIIKREKNYRSRIDHEPVTGAVELF